MTTYETRIALTGLYSFNFFTSSFSKSKPNLLLHDNERKLRDLLFCQPPNDYLMTILNRADQNFFALKQRMDTTASHAQIINFSKLKCPQAISNFNNRPSSLVSNYGESTRQFASLTPARNQVFSEMQNHYDNKIVMTPAKYQKLSQIITPPIANFKLPLNRAHNDASAIPSIVENELADCFLR